MNAGIEPSRSTWAALPGYVRAAARDGRATLDGAIAAVAYGRHLHRRAIQILIVTGTFMVLFIGTVLASVDLGRWPDDDATPLIVFAPLAGAGMIAFFAYAQRGIRLIRSNIALVAAHPGADLPSEVQLGTRRPRLQLYGVVTVLLALTISLSLIGERTPRNWIEAAFAGVAVIAIIASGPSALGLETGLLDRTGIRVNIVDVHVPWTSVGSIQIVGMGRIAIGVVGPVTTGTKRPGRWTKATLRRFERRKRLLINTTRPDLALWVSAQYVGPTKVTTPAPH